jgi:hypothetical protein
VYRELKMQVVNEFPPLPRIAAIFQVDDLLLSRGIFNQQIGEAILPVFGILSGWSRTVEISIILPLVC